MFVALVIQYGKRLCRITLSFVACLSSPYSSTLSHYSGKELLNVKYVFWFSVQIRSETLLILTRIQRHIIVNLKTFPCKVPFILVRFYPNLNFLCRFSRNPLMSNFMNISPVGTELLHAYRRTAGHEEANGRFFKSQTRLKMAVCTSCMHKVQYSS